MDIATRKQQEHEAYVSYGEYITNDRNKIFDIGWSFNEHCSVQMLTPKNHWGFVEGELLSRTGMIQTYPVEVSTVYKTKLVLETDPLPPGCNIPIWELPENLNDNDNVLEIAQYDPASASHSGPWQCHTPVGNVSHITTRYHPTARQVKPTLTPGNKSKFPIKFNDYHPTVEKTETLERTTPLASAAPEPTMPPASAATVQHSNIEVIYWLMIATVPLLTMLIYLHAGSFLYGSDFESERPLMAYVCQCSGKRNGSAWRTKIRERPFPV